ncbi:MAG: membrane protein insertion efficiency factor YidD [Candidatus Paraimprobicoccus trichonymphae]|uniref:Putative membrane protein insertion efficiency factor n=1 Tax=Candidatus Paraimprobicoccus trichonymphae TaxID=3033793 RepID=A0AA48HWE5_9FIRM|nr:MAG: membrane protein insertion efficiency factor YidD [Candidatus Paraimprobicoccus trichonymphae]
MKKLLINLIFFYKKFISPCLRPCCRFHPCCSSYAIESLEKFGAFKGIYLSLIRILRCNKFFEGGYDPVP